METKLEKKLLCSYKKDLVAYMDNHPEFFEEAISLALSDKQPYSWRAAWLLADCMVYNDKRIKKHIKEIARSIELREDGHQRELLRILLNTDSGSNEEGIIFDICMNLWEQPGKPPAVRVNALKLISKIAKKHPELAKELSFLTQEHLMESLSAGGRNSVSKIMKQFKEK